MSPSTVPGGLAANRPLTRDTRLMERSPQTSAHVTVRELFALAAFEGVEVLGGESGLDAKVTSVQLAPRSRTEFPIEPHALLIVDAARVAVDSFFLDLVLRWASEADAAAVAVINPEAPLGLAPRRLSRNLGLPLAKVNADTYLLLDALREAVLEPERQLVTLVAAAATQLGMLTDRTGLSGPLRVLENVLDASTSLVGIAGTAIAGGSSAPELQASERLPVYTVSGVDGHLTRAVQPISLAAGEPPSFWLVVERPSATAHWQRGAKLVMGIASQYLALILMSERLVQERDARLQLGVLNAIVSTENPDSTLMQQISTLGWPVDGWCSGIHINFSGSQDEFRLLSQARQLHVLLQEHGVNGPLIERSDGWTTWMLDDREPQSGAYRVTSDRVRRVLREIHGLHSESRVSAGVGRPQLGLRGLRFSLEEAQEAASIAKASGTRLLVQHIDELGLERVLFRWYTSPEFKEFAQSVLKPIHDIDDGELMRTLEVYLDHESSPTVTADMLGVHRNTIMNRLFRIKSALAADLDDVDQRLAIQLACKAFNLDA